MLKTMDLFIEINCSDINLRNIQKIKLYLISHNIKFSFDENIFNVECSNKDIQFKFLVFLKQLNVFTFDEGSEKVIKDKEAKDKKFEKKKAELVSIKDGYGYDLSSFEDFCFKCDINLKIKLRDYQYKSAFLIYKSRNGFDFSVPGAGKTIISYATYLNLRLDNIVDNVFIVGPKNSYNAWYDEYFTCFGVNPDFQNLSFDTIENCKTYLGTSKVNHSKINFINYEKLKSLKNLIINFISQHNTLLIIDEAHKVKNPKAYQTIALMEISKYAKCRIELTGTPLPNGYEDLFSQCQICFPDTKILPYNYGELKSLTLNGNIDKETKLMNSLYPYFSRVSKKYLLESGELQKPIFETIKVNMSSKQRDIYNMIGTMPDDIRNDWESSFALALKKAIMIRQMQASANPSLLSRAIFSSLDDFKNMITGEVETVDSEKNFLEMMHGIEEADKYLSDKLNSSIYAKLIINFKNNNVITEKNRVAVDLCIKLIKSGEKVILWDVFVDNMYILSNLLMDKGVSSKIINGSISNLDRQTIIKEFKEGNLMALIASPATMAESISLHKVCQHAIYVNRNYNAAQFIQSKDRIHRINMPYGKTAHYYFIENMDSIDENVSERLGKKETRMLRMLDSDQISVGEIEDSENSGVTLDDMKSYF